LFTVYTIIIITGWPENDATISKYEQIVLNPANATALIFSSL